MVEITDAKFIKAIDNFTTNGKIPDIEDHAVLYTIRKGLLDGNFKYSFDSPAPVKKPYQRPSRAKPTSGAKCLHIFKNGNQCSVDGLVGKLYCQQHRDEEPMPTLDDLGASQESGAAQPVVVQPRQAQEDKNCIETSEAFAQTEADMSTDLYPKIELPMAVGDSIEGPAQETPNDTPITNTGQEDTLAAPDSEAPKRKAIEEASDSSPNKFPKPTEAVVEDEKKVKAFRKALDKAMKKCNTDCLQDITSDEWIKYCIKKLREYFNRDGGITFEGRSKEELKADWESLSPRWKHAIKSAVLLECTF